jgi:hypothetical protein
MDYELISAEEYDNLPHDDEQCFVEFEAICRPHVSPHFQAMPKASEKVRF